MVAAVLIAAVIMGALLLIDGLISRATATSTALTTSPASPVPQGTLVMLTATVAPAAATGTVQFKDRADNIGVPVAVSNGAPSGTALVLAVGSHQLTAVFTPTDAATYDSSTSPVETFMVTYSTKVPATYTALATSPTSSVPEGNPVTLIATVTPAAATGTVQFKDGADNIGAPVTVSNGAASKTTLMFAVGSHQLSAVFTPPNPAVYGSSTSQPVSLTVTARQ